MRIQSCIILIAAALSFAGCGINTESPENVLQTYRRAVESGDKDVAYKLLSIKDRTIKSLEEYRGKNSEDLWFSKAFSDVTTYKVISTDIRGEKASIKLESRYPDLNVIVADYEAAKKSGDEEARKKVVSRMKAHDFPKMSETSTFDLVLEPDGWKIFVDYEKDAKVAELLKEARKLKDKKKFVAALEKFKEASSLRPNEKYLQDYAQETVDLAKKQAESEAYIPKVELYQLQGRYYNSVLDGRLPGVEFKLKNTGDRTLNEVEVCVYFHDASGTILAEKIYHPVLVISSEYSYSRNNSPLKPGYIWQHESGKFYSAKHVPSEWKPGAVTAKVTYIKFAED